MKRFLYFLTVIVVILIILANYKMSEVVIDPETLKGTAKENFAEYYSVDITYDASIPEEDIKNVQTAIRQMPAEVIKDFVESGWRVVVVPEIEDMEQPAGVTEYMTVGLTDFGKKTVQITPIQYDGITDFVRLKTLHEMSHFADRETYNRASETEAFKELYDKNKGIYIEHEFAGVDETPDNKLDRRYATSSTYEFFACAMKDYLENPSYLQANYMDIYEYFDKLVKEK